MFVRNGGTGMPVQKFGKFFALDATTPMTWRVRYHAANGSYTQDVLTDGVVRSTLTYSTMCLYSLLENTDRVRICKGNRIHGFERGISVPSESGTDRVTGGPRFFLRSRKRSKSVCRDILDCLLISHRSIPQHNNKAGQEGPLLGKENPLQDRRSLCKLRHDTRRGTDVESR